MLEDELRRGLQDDRKHPAVRDDRRRALGEVRCREGQRRVRAARLADRELADVPVLGAPVRPPVHELVLDEEHGPLVVDRNRQERAEVVALARSDDADVRDPEQELLERLAVRRPVPAARAHRRPHDERHRHLVVVHLPELRDPVHDLVEAERDEVAEHDLEDRALPAQGHPAATPNSEASLIGVVSTRSGYASREPAVTLNAPP